MKVIINRCYGGYGLSETALRWLMARGYSGDPHSLEERTNPLIVECVEQLGDDASGSCSKLEVEDVDGDLYRIDEYDGLEEVHTPGSTEWIINKYR